MLCVLGNVFEIKNDIDGFEIIGYFQILQLKRGDIFFPQYIN